mmetsp:Transcript_6768/g.14657  ORF Transcript_6768/g.14657 Transcript_6768/m.14657 type:complete len:83 (+) Transcript_6768:131-379(+)
MIVTEICSPKPYEDKVDVMSDHQQVVSALIFRSARVVSTMHLPQCTQVPMAMQNGFFLSSSGSRHERLNSKLEEMHRIHRYV